jgi:hypothetical protein
MFVANSYCEIIQENAFSGGIHCRWLAGGCLRHGTKQRQLD